MASGHRHHHHRPLPKRLLILITPAAVETITRWVAAAIINRTFDIPLTAGASVDHLTVYLSRLLQERLTEPVSGISFDPARTLAWHELAELFFMTVDGCSYDDAHHIATIAFEKVAVERLGLNWEGYCHLFDGLVEKIENAPVERCPRDLVMTPYTEDESSGMVEAVRRAQGMGKGYNPAQVRDDHGRWAPEGQRPGVLNPVRPVHPMTGTIFGAPYSRSRPASERSDGGQPLEYVDTFAERFGDEDYMADSSYMQHGSAALDLTNNLLPYTTVDHFETWTGKPIEDFTPHLNEFLLDELDQASKETGGDDAGAQYTALAKFSPDQPRDGHGRWTESGSPGHVEVVGRVRQFLDKVKPTQEEWDAVKHHLTPEQIAQVAKNPHVWALIGATGVISAACLALGEPAMILHAVGWGWWALDLKDMAEKWYHRRDAAAKAAGGPAQADVDKMLRGRSYAERRQLADSLLRGLPDEAKGKMLAWVINNGEPVTKYDEAKHPRGPHGRWASGDGSWIDDFLRHRGDEERAAADQARRAGYLKDLKLKPTDRLPGESYGEAAIRGYRHSTNVEPEGSPGEAGFFDRFGWRYPKGVDSARNSHLAADAGINDIPKTTWLQRFVGQLIQGIPELDQEWNFADDEDVLKFDPGESRDYHGKWTTGGVEKPDDKKSGEIAAEPSKHGLPRKVLAQIVGGAVGFKIADLIVGFGGYVIFAAALASGLTQPTAAALSLAMLVPGWIGGLKARRWVVDRFLKRQDVTVDQLNEFLSCFTPEQLQELATALKPLEQLAPAQVKELIGKAKVAKYDQNRDAFGRFAQSAMPPSKHHDALDRMGFSRESSSRDGATNVHVYGGAPPPGPAALPDYLKSKGFKPKDTSAVRDASPRHEDVQQWENHDTGEGALLGPDGKLYMREPAGLSSAEPEELTAMANEEGIRKSDDEQESSNFHTRWEDETEDSEPDRDGPQDLHPHIFGGKPHPFVEGWRLHHPELITRDTPQLETRHAGLKQTQIAFPHEPISPRSTPQYEHMMNDGSFMDRFYGEPRDYHGRWTSGKLAKTDTVSQGTGLLWYDQSSANRGEDEMDDDWLEDETRDELGKVGTGGTGYDEAKHPRDRTGRWTISGADDATLDPILITQLEGQDISLARKRSFAWNFLRRVATGTVIAAAVGVVGLGSLPAWAAYAAATVGGIAGNALIDANIEHFRPTLHDIAATRLSQGNEVIAHMAKGALSLDQIDKILACFTEHQKQRIVDHMERHLPTEAVIQIAKQIAGSRGKVAKAFDGSKHPRGVHGKFGSRMAAAETLAGHDKPFFSGFYNHPDLKAAMEQRWGQMPHEDRKVMAYHMLGGRHG